MDRARRGVLWGMKKLTIPVAAGALAIALASCGSSTKHTAAPSANPSAGVLVDSSGMALYSPVGESAKNVRCTGACASVWKPLRPGAANLKGAAVITRPDGTKQVTVGGRPLYTFVQDSPGAASGDGASDAFGGKQFTWHAVKAGGATSNAGKPASKPAGGGYSNGY